MQRKLSDRFLSMKIRLALSTEKLRDAGQENFAGYICSNIDKAYILMDEAAEASNYDEATLKLSNLVDCLCEIETVLLACKVGVALPFESDTLQKVREVKMELKEIIRRQEFVGNLVL